MFWWRSQNQWRETQLPRKKEAEHFEFDAWSGFRNWRMSFTSEVSSCASRPIEAMVWIRDVESAKSELQTHFEVFDWN